MNNRLLILLAAATTLAFGHAEGPDPRYTGAPGDDPLACSTSGCHTGTALNAGGGSVTISFPDGMTYTPGQPQTLTVTVSDPKARTYGFQLSARLASNPANGQAGDFSASAGEIVLCDDGSLKSSKGCSANASVEFIEHSIPNPKGVWSITWTPPSTNVGNITFYVAGNGANGDGTNLGDHIYTANFTISAAAGGSKPDITAAGVHAAAAFNPAAGVSSGTWLEIYGSNISSVTRGWDGTDFSGVKAPTSLSGVTVTINNLPAYVDYIASGQVNVQVPEDPTTGPVQLVVSNSAGSAAPVTIQKVALAPALLAPGVWNVGGKQYVVAQYATDANTYVGPPNLIPGLNFRPAKAGDIITIYGIGFGPVTPNTPAGTVASGITSLVNQPTFLFGQTQGILSCSGCYYGLTSGAVGLYQFNIQVPNGPSGDVPLTVQVGGVTLKQQLYITLQ